MGEREERGAGESGEWVRGEKPPAVRSASVSFKAGSDGNEGRKKCNERDTQLHRHADPPFPTHTPPPPPYTHHHHTAVPPPPAAATTTTGAGIHHHHHCHPHHHQPARLHRTPRTCAHRRGHHTAPGRWAPRIQRSWPPRSSCRRRCPDGRRPAARVQRYC